MTADELKSEFEHIRGMLCERGVKAKADKICGITMPHTLWMCERALTELIPQAKMNEAHQYLGFCQRAILGFGVYSAADLKKGSKSLSGFFEEEK